MPEYIYTTVTGKIKQLLEKIRTVGIPPKVAFSWLNQIGFTSSNDRTLIGVLQFIGFIDQSSVPTAKWSAYRGGRYRTILGEAIRAGYSELYAIYPDAHLRPTTDLNHIFSTSSSAGAQVVGKTVATFKALVDEAEFPDSAQPSETTLETTALHIAPANAPQIPQRLQAKSEPALHIDIQIHISAESSADQIEKVFESMAKHLYGQKEN